MYCSCYLTIGFIPCFPKHFFYKGRNVVLYVGRELIQFLIQPCCVTLVGQYFVKCINYLALKLCDADVQYILEGWFHALVKGTSVSPSLSSGWMTEH